MLTTSHQREHRSQFRRSMFEFQTTRKQPSRARIAGMFAPLVPKAARQRTGKDTPYFVPACALRTIGMSTIVLPRSIVIIACHQFIPASMKPPARV